MNLNSERNPEQHPLHNITSLPCTSRCRRAGRGHSPLRTPGPPGFPPSCTGPGCPGFGRETLNIHKLEDGWMLWSPEGIGPRYYDKLGRLK